MSSSGIGAQGLDQKLWVLADLDHPTQKDVVGQFVPQSVRKDVSGDIAVAGSVNRDYPILQWTAGELEVVTFTAKLWAKDSEDMTVEQRLLALENLVRRASDLGRPPICAFSWGGLGTLNLECLVKTIGGVTYDEVREDGTLRGVTLEITLQRYEEVTLVATDPSKPETYTRVRRAKKGDTYESVALWEYSDPELGILLRQLNPRRPGMELADLRPNDKVHVYPEEFLLTLPIEPEFHAFKSGPGYEAAEARRRELFDARSGDAYVTIFGDTADEEFL
jgi:hypothetical protein